MKVTAIGLLAVGMFTVFGWKWAPEWAQADVWNASMAILAIFLLGALALAYRGYPRLVLVCCYLAVLFMFTAGCSMLWLASPLEVLPGQDQCDARFKMPLALVGLFVGLVVLVLIRSPRGGKNPKP